MEEAIKLNELTSRREKLKVISLLGQEIIKDTVQINKDRAENFLKSATSLIDKKKEQAKSKWRSFKENIAKRIENINKKINDTKKFLRVNAKLGVRKIRQVPKEAAKGMADLGKSVAKVGLQGAGLVVGGVVLSAQKFKAGAENLGASMVQGARDTKASVLHAKRRVRDVKNNTIDGAKAFVGSAKSLMTSAREGLAQKWQSLKDGARRTAANLAVRAIIAKDNVKAGIETGVRAVKQAPKEIGDAFVKGSKSVAKVGLQGAGLVVGGVVLSAQKIKAGAENLGASMVQGARDTKASVLHAKRRVRDVKNNTIEGAKAFVGSAKSLMTSAKEGLAQKWQSLKDGARRTATNLAVSAIIAKDNVKAGIETGVRAVKQAPKEIGDAFVKGSKSVAKAGLQGAGLVVGGVVLSAQKIKAGAENLGASMVQGARDTKASVLHAKRRVRDVKNNTIDGAKAFVGSAKSLMTSAKEGMAQKWQSLKDGARRTATNLAVSAIIARDNVKAGIETGVRAVKQAPKEIGDAFVKGSKSVAKAGLQGAGLVVGGVVLGVKKAKEGAENLGASMVQGARDTKASVLHAKRRVRDVKNNTIDGAKAFVGSAKSLMTSAREGLAQKWQSTKEGASKAWTSTKEGIASTKASIKAGVEAGVRTVKEVPQNVGNAMVNLGTKVADYSKQGAGLVVGSVVLGAQKASQLASDVKQGALDAALVASVSASLTAKKLKNEVTQVKQDIAKGFVNGAQSVVMGGKNLANSVVQGYGDLKKGAKDTFVAMGEDIRNSKLAKEVRVGLDKSGQNFMKGYNAALAGSGRG